MLLDHDGFVLIQLDFFIIEKTFSLHSPLSHLQEVT